MKLGRQHALTGFVALALIAFGIWIALNTEWVEVRVPDPRRQSAPHDADFQLKQLATRLAHRSALRRTSTSCRRSVQRWR